MSDLSAPLTVATDPGWAKVAVKDFDAFLQDHANCERKASALAMSLVVKYADREKILSPLIALAQEELSHFRQVFDLMQTRGLGLVKDSPDPYINQLLPALRHGRDERFLDRLLLATLIESRGAERFRLVAEALEEPALKSFYEHLWKSEDGHGLLFVELAKNYFSADAIHARLAELAEHEGMVISGLAWRSALH